MSWSLNFQPHPFLPPTKNFRDTSFRDTSVIKTKCTMWFYVLYIQVTLHNLRKNCFLWLYPFRPVTHQILNSTLVDYIIRRSAVTLFLIYRIAWYCHLMLSLLLEFPETQFLVSLELNLSSTLSWLSLLLRVVFIRNYARGQWSDHMVVSHNHCYPVFSSSTF